MTAARHWLGAFDTLAEARAARTRDLVGPEVMYVCDTFGRWFVVPAESVETFAGYVSRRREIEARP